MRSLTESLAGLTLRRPINALTPPISPLHSSGLEKAGSGYFFGQWVAIRLETTLDFWKICYIDKDLQDVVDP